MTQSFDQWFTTYRPSLDTSAIEAEFIYEAGAQSKQAEIDSINRDLNHAFATVEIQEAEIDELHKANINLLKTKQSALREVDELRKQLDLINQYTAAQGESIKICNGERLKLRKRIEKTDSLIMSFGDSIDVPLRNSLIDAIRGLEDL